MDWLTIEGVAPYDGRYELDLEGRELTTREWGWIKRLSGYLPLTIAEGFGDPELVTVLAAIALRRAGKVEAAAVPAVYERLSDAPFGAAIVLDTDREDDEDDAGPPARSSNGNEPTSGESSTTSSESSESIPNPSGMAASAISESDPLTSVS